MRKKSSQPQEPPPEKVSKEQLNAGLAERLKPVHAFIERTNRQLRRPISWERRNKPFRA